MGNLHLKAAGPFTDMSAYIGVFFSVSQLISKHYKPIIMYIMHFNK